jgi:hypothetical protein
MPLALARLGASEKCEVAQILRNRYMQAVAPPESDEAVRSESIMGAEIQSVVEDIKRSIGLLRRHL